MSWHCGCLVLRKDANASDLRARLTQEYDSVGETDSLDVVLGDSTSLALHESQDCLVVLDPLMFLESLGELSTGLWPRWLEDVLRKFEVSGFSFLLEGASATYGFAVYQSGVCVRLFLSQNNTTLLDSGELQSFEVSGTGDRGIDEQAIFDLLLAYGFDLTQILSASFELFELR